MKSRYKWYFPQGSLHTNIIYEYFEIKTIDTKNLQLAAENRIFRCTIRDNVQALYV